MFCAAFYYTQQLLSAVHESQQLLHAFTQIYRNTHFYVAPPPSIEGNITCYTPFICPIVNLKMENFTTLKLRVDVTHIRNNWKRNFEVKSSMVKVSGNRSWCTSSQKLHRFTYNQNRDDPHYMLHISSNIMQQWDISSYGSRQRLISNPLCHAAAAGTRVPT